MAFWNKREKPTTGPMQRAHIPIVMAIDCDAYTDPLLESLYVQSLDTSGPYRSFVSFGDATVTGFLLARFASGWWRILRLAVHKEFRRKGFGSKLLRLVTDDVDQGRCVGARCMLRESNEGGLLFLKKREFANANPILLPNHYRHVLRPQDTEDGIWFLREFQDSFV